ncbi:Cof-type HAD-IIB family hydrolase [Tetragenococcus osmophilus]|uniref:Cof-type HAD-IIB family hydrolase n=1 Tax=Tetragenococcus osmophilus TaxID=526944 RepID=A0AA37XJW0_9ENTE|nr:Cof-type HAD-IIB family hydrolase [Tetragenococcus osmophilus]AYW47922.1 Cof-type HAD-IIB family hydrolase [Tetragenococcus osmophilus]GMA72433.1 haloacid dehalogenase [Tetragenococcus osmophilus]
MIKLIAIDLDGTLLDDEKKISLRNKKALQAARAQGTKVVICTGRPLAGIRPYLEELEMQSAGDYSITFNGGLVQKNDTGEIVEKAALKQEDVLDLVDLAQNLNLPLDVLSDEVVLSLPTSAQHLSLYPQLNPLLTFQAATVEEMTPERLYNKAVVGYHQDYLDQQIAKIPASYKERYEVIKSRGNLLEFMPKGITKAFGIAALAQDLAFSQEEVMGIGDEENDLPMIEYAGFGVAMDNAVALVKQKANIITGTNEEDGVAQVVENYVLP